MPSSSPRPPVRIAVVDHPVVAAGIRAFCSASSNRVTSVELGAFDCHADVVLVDDLEEVLAKLVATADAKVVVFTEVTRPAAVAHAMANGAAGYLHKGLTAERLLDALERIARCEPGTVIEVPADEAPGSTALTQRETEVLTSICLGLSNNEIAAKYFLSINSVKTYVRTAYAKMGVSSRTQAVLWGLSHGLSTRESGGGDRGRQPANRAPQDQ